MTILKPRCAFFMLFLPVSSQAGVVADLPKPGCYKTDWTARDEMRVNGELAKITTSTIDGSTGFKRVKLEIPNGDGWSKEESGTGAFYKLIQNDGSSLVSMCPTTGRFDGNNGFDFTIACRNMTLDPGKLQFERIPDTAEKWEVKTNTVIRSQIGMNNAAAAQNDTIAMLEKLLANAQPRTDAERRQVAEHRAAIAALKKEQAQNTQNIEKARAEIQERARSGTAEERIAANAALVGAQVEHTTLIVEVLTWAGSQCPVS
jgi:hypothetical protein